MTICNHCNYSQLLASANLAATPKRLAVLETIGDSAVPLSAADIHSRLDTRLSINRVTVYRILDLFVERQIAQRISTSSRTSFYGIAPNKNHKAHPHFYCTTCGHMDCLSPGSLNVKINDFAQTFPGRVDALEMRLDGICNTCLKKQSH